MTIPPFYRYPFFGIYFLPDTLSKLSSFFRFSSIFSIKSDVIPYICKKQFASSNRKHQHHSDQRPTIFDYLRLKEEENEEAPPSTTMHLSALPSLNINNENTRHNSTAPSLTRRHTSEELLSCYAFVLADGFCYRTNTPAIYAEANRQFCLSCLVVFT